MGSVEIYSHDFCHHFHECVSKKCSVIYFTSEKNQIFKQKSYVHAEASTRVIAHVKKKTLSQP